MRSPSLLATFALTALLSLSCPDAAGQQNVMNSPVVYEIFVQSFCDSNGDGIGDLRGIISRLDYIRQLGADAIWITPIHPSPSYHKYDITDYRAIHPQYGTPDDFDMLVRSVHERGMKLIMDLVINHTSWDHPWFKASASAKDNPYRDYYVWRDYADVEAEISKKTTTFDSDNLTQWHEWPGDAQRYYGFFWKGMPDLNFDHPPVRQEVYTIAKYWLDKGVDGFRLDAAKHIYPDDEPDKTKAFWEEFRFVITAHKPDVLIFGEVWADPETLAGFFPGMPKLFNFELARAITETVREGRAEPLRDLYVRIQAAYAQNPSPLDDAILLSNHDMVRIRSAVGGDIAKARLAASILLTLPGTAFIYYGEELGMLGGKPDEHLREPFPWTKDTYAEKHWLAITQSTMDKVSPASEQMNDPESLYAHYKSWIALRHDLELGTASLSFLSDLPEGLIGWRSCCTT
jgi:glycosidase